MALDNLISSLIRELDTLRQERDGVDVEIAQIDAKIAQTNAAPVHTDDIVAAFLRGQDQAKSDFLSRVGKHFTQEHYKKKDLATLEKGSPLILMLPAMLTREWLDLLPVGSMSFLAGPLDIGAVSYFMDASIRAELPALVDQFLPQARFGLSRVKRDEVLAELERARQPLWDRREDLTRQIDSVHAATGGYQASA